MIKDLLISFKDNITEKTKNPFLGTYLLVWIVRNWELVYSLFNFDKGIKLKDKVLFIKAYYKENNFIENLLTNVLWAFGLLILTYILLNLSRLIVNFFEKRLTPWIFKITDSKSIVLKSEYDLIRNELIETQNRLDNERDSKSKLENRIKSLQEELLGISDNDKSNNKILSDDYLNTLYNKLREKEYVQDFVKTASMINRKEFINNDYLPKDYFLDLGLITYIGTSSGGGKQYVLTGDGDNLLRIIRVK